MALKAVFFDVGETLIDETRSWTEWADWLGVPRFTFLAALGAVIARGEHHWRVFEWFSPGFDLETAYRQRRAEGWSYGFEKADLYPDAIPCLTALRDRNLLVGIVGNQPVEAKDSLRALEVPSDIIGTSSEWGVAKPSIEFFSRIVSASQDAVGHVARNEIVYVGDHPENDIAPAADAGLLAVFLRRGPWAIMHANSVAANRAALRVDSLSELPHLLDDLQT